MADRAFETTPEIPWLRLLTKRGRGLRTGDTLPRLESTVARPDTQGAAAYARLCGLPASEHLPLLWPHVMAGRLHLDMLAHPEFPLAGMGMVHVANRVVQRRPLRAEEPLRLRCAWTGWSRVKRGAEITLLTQVEVGDEVPWEGTSTYLSTAVQGEGEATRADPEPLREVQRSTTWRLPADLGRQYAAVSGDYNPIHIHPWGAKLFGFKRTILHGMWSVARGLGELDAPPGAWTLDVVFRRPLLLPGAVLFESAPDGAFQVRQLRDRKLNLYGALAPT